MEINTQTTAGARAEVASPLEFTGERMVPDAADIDSQCYWEHIYRYRFASKYARSRRVLDVACGEGYGSAALSAAGAISVVGVDISPETVAHARKKYGIDAREGNAECVPLGDASVDLVVSFETIEHVPSPARMLDECRRVCVPGGLVIISTPNKLEYSEYDNPFHCSELTIPEFLSLMGGRFEDVKLFSQRPNYAPWWSLRVVASRRSAWNRIRGAGRGFQAIRRLFCPHLFQPRALDAVQTILAPAKGVAFFDPYVVRAMSPEGSDRPMYVVAVGRVPYGGGH